MRRVSLLCLALLASGCDRDEPTEEMRRTFDPAIADALRQPLMIDPEMVLQNDAASAYAVVGDDIGAPLPFLGADAEARAREEAAQLLGAANSVNLPDPQAVAALDPAPTLAARLARNPLIGDRCEGASSAYRWAARMPSDIPIYPHGATMAARGVDSTSCNLRAVRFESVVPAEEIAGFYWSIAKRAQMSPRFLAASEAFVVAGTRAGRGFTATIQAVNNGATQVDLVVVAR